MSEHADVRAALEIAAVEPGGLDRLEAGDAPDAALVVGHLAGCPTCIEELARLRRAETLLRPAIADAPDPALRERTLAFVREVGVRRGDEAAARAADASGSRLAAPLADPPAQPPGIQPPSSAGEQPPGLGRVDHPARLRSPRRFAWTGAVAAALVIGLVGGALLPWPGVPGSPAGNADPATALAAVSRETSELLAAGDAREIVLRDASGSPGGSLVLSPSEGRLVVTATGLAAPPAGSEHRCWVEAGGVRTALGTMWRAGNVAWWSGPVALPAELPPGVVYGVSLVDAGSAGAGTEVLTGELEGAAPAVP